MKLTRRPKNLETELQPRKAAEHLEEALRIGKEAGDEGVIAAASGLSPYALTPNTVELIPTLGALPPPGSLDHPLPSTKFRPPTFNCQSFAANHFPSK